MIATLPDDRTPIALFDVKNFPEYYRPFFEKYSASLKRCGAEAEVIVKKFGVDTAHPRAWHYLCPLCLSNLLIAEEDKEGNLRLSQSAAFNEDHFPPKNVAGKEWMLVCESCNSTAGHKFDNKLFEFIQLRNYGIGFPGAYIDEVKISIPQRGYGGPYKVSMIRDTAGKATINVPDGKGLIHY